MPFARLGGAEHGQLAALGQRLDLGLKLRENCAVALTAGAQKHWGDSEAHKTCGGGAPWGLDPSARYAKVSERMDLMVLSTYATSLSSCGLAQLARRGNAATHTDTVWSPCRRGIRWKSCGA